MPKTRDQKLQLVKQLKDRLTRKKALLLLNYQGLKVEETEILRKQLREKEIDFNIAKNSLLKIVLNEKGIIIGQDITDQPLALAFSYDDEVTVSKEITLFARDHQAVQILGGIIEDGFVGPETIEQLAKLPSREELLAKAVGSIATPLSGLVNVLTGNIRGLVSVLKQYQLKV